MAMDGESSIECGNNFKPFVINGDSSLDLLIEESKEVPMNNMKKM